MADTDIVIVGAGPTGLVMALELAAHGVAFRLVDKAEQPATQSRALVMHARTLELLSRHGHGLREKLLTAGTSPEGASVMVGGHEVVQAQLPNMAALLSDSAHPTPIVIHQCNTERALLDALQTKYGISPKRGVTVANIKQDDTGVSLTLNGKAVRCKYIVGADGSHSAVRHSAPAMTFDGAQYPQDFILCDVHVRPGSNPRPLNRVHFCLGQGMLVLMPLDGGKMVRLVASRAGRFTAEAAKDQPTLADFQDFLDDMMPGFGTLHDPVWITRYRLHHRGVNTYRDGRLFVAGDAAHIHSPAGGQGMNTGIQDAVNLGWKLAAAVRHANASPSSSLTATSPAYIERLLDSYHAERHPVGQKLLSSTDYLFSWLTWNNPVYLALRNTLVPYIVPRLMSRSGTAAKQAKTYRFMSQLGIRYAKSPLVRTGTGFEGPVRGGSRAPDGRVVSAAGAVRESAGSERWLLSQLAGDRHTLLLFSGGAGAGAAVEAGLEAARTRFVKTAGAAAASTGGKREVVDVLTIYAQGVAATTANTDEAYVDAEPGNLLHERYGFQDKAGFVYVRPDLYIAHIGYIESSMDELLESMKADA